ncbi:maltose ABC transporter permease MalF [Motiliproteus sp. MSK22-1]|uniref:maltose ABC transporter permease MalF n=1 Tax=Motiliproteus sp. MSK22-1 TaxID=1897630 RepID=UPI0009759DBE|nr:maltose ABC transporter permease MalF [Motiliproteus sp. MSK22-1]OMH29099.1 maltose transporter [Motiliproteus sp. MSK22-1]
MSTQALPMPQSQLHILFSHRLVKLTAVLLVNLFALYLVVALYAQQQIAFALLLLVLIASASYIFFSKKAYAHRYIYPSLAGMGIFVIFPLLYTVGIGFTNYSASNLLSLERVQEFHLSQTYVSSAGKYQFQLFESNGQYRIQVYRPDVPGQQFSTESFSLGDEVQSLTLYKGSTALPEPLKIRQIIKLKAALAKLRLNLPQGGELRLSGLRQFAAVTPVYVRGDGNTLINQQNGEQIRPNFDTGFYQTSAGEALSPGFTVAVGWQNFTRVVTDPNIREPFLQIFVWTLLFSALSVLFTLVVGLLLANLLQWEQLRGKGFYRTMLILPYAVPAFISILVFKGLFNQNFGEINLVLGQLFGIEPTWFSDPLMAKSMILIVNTWLGYPYILLLCMGLLQSIPGDLYEASTMDGAGPVDNLLRITLPLVIKPLVPLLIASFAFNFNNFVLISLLTGGSPDIIGATTPAGTTDLLVSYTYRIAFQDSGQNFGLAAAIATVIFLMVGALALINLKLSKIKI